MKEPTEASTMPQYCKQCNLVKGAVNGLPVRCVHMLVGISVADVQGSTNSAVSPLTLLVWSRDRMKTKG